MMRRHRERRGMPQKAAPSRTTTTARRTGAVPAADGADAKPATGRRRAGAVDDLGALDGHLGYFIRRLQIWVFQDFIRTLAPLEISPAQFSVLSVIHANEGLSQAELGNTLAIERARLVRLL